MEPALLVERDGHIVTLTLNRPARKNAFNPEVLCRLCDAYDMIDHLSDKYWGKPFDHAEGEVRVTYRIRPESVQPKG